MKKNLIYRSWIRFYFYKKLKIKDMLLMMKNGLMEWLVFQCQYLIQKKNYVFVYQLILQKVEKILMI